MIYSHQNPSATFNTLVASNTTENAFPSQHTATVFATALPLLYRGKRKIGGLLLGSGLLTGFARVYIGEHWPLDIFGAIVAAGLALIIAELTWKHLEPVWKPIIQLCEKIEERLKDLY
jgi:undecaprenyl-diphosphatase